MYRSAVIVFVAAAMASMAASAASEVSGRAGGNPPAQAGKSLNGKPLDGKSLSEKQINGKPLDGRFLQEQFGGIVTDQTITVAGQDFYQQFVALWREKPLHERYAISVRERPSARWGNEIWVEYAQRRVFQAVLPANRSNIKSISEQAVEIAYRNVVDADVQRMLFRDPDIAPDEF